MPSIKRKEGKKNESFSRQRGMERRFGEDKTVAEALERLQKQNGPQKPSWDSVTFDIAYNVILDLYESDHFEDVKTEEEEKLLKELPEENEMLKKTIAGLKGEITKLAKPKKND